MESHFNALVDFLAAHASWAGPAMFVVSFGESLAFVSFAFPGSTLLIAAGTLLPSGILPLAPVLVGAIAGAVTGDGVSYWIGRRFGHAVSRIWPFSRHPRLIPAGISFFAKHGDVSVFIGRFFGPVRAVVPLVAGVLRMRPLRFWIANIGSAVVWAPALLLPGAIFGKLIERFGWKHLLVPLAVALFVAVIVAGLWLRLRRHRLNRPSASVDREYGTDDE